MLPPRERPDRPVVGNVGARPTTEVLLDRKRSDGVLLGWKRVAEGEGKVGGGSGGEGGGRGEGGGEDERAKRSGRAGGGRRGGEECRECVEL
mgnify:CR=1 FL=1